MRNEQSGSNDNLMLLFAAFMVLSGMLAVCYPNELIIPHATTSLRARPATLVERVPTPQTRLYGSLAIVGGFLIGAFIFWSRKT